MKFCPYCGVSIKDSAVSFCAECGKPLSSPTPSRPPQNTIEPGITQRLSGSGGTGRLLVRKKTKPPSEESVPKAAEETDLPAQDGYDGYYDDVRPADNGHSMERMEPELIKRVVLIGIGLLIVVGLSIAAMYFL